MVKLEQSTVPIDVKTIKKDFPIFTFNDRGESLVYLDSAASSQRPSQVLVAMDDYYRRTHANVHRGVYQLAENATKLYEKARTNVGKFIGAKSPATEVIFTKNATEAINLVAKTWGIKNLKQGDKVVVTVLEHHANLVPWLMLKESIGIELEYIEIDANGLLDLSDLEAKLNGAKLVAISMASNVLGTLTPIEDITKMAHDNGALILADGAQFVPHNKIDVSSLDIDFLAFTGHKMLGPTGIGVLWAKEKLLEAMPPFLGGGEMILDVRRDRYLANDLPYKFEAGTPPIAEAIGLDAAVKYLESIGMDNIKHHDHFLIDYSFNLIEDLLGDAITIYGPKRSQNSLRNGLISFGFEGVHPHDIAQVLDSNNVCVRAGHHCAKPLMSTLCTTATTRASFYFYNSTEDVDRLVDGLIKIKEMFL